MGAALDWERMFALETPLLEIFLRGSVTYLALFTILRLFLRRQAGTVGVTDLLVVVLIADAAQNAMAGDYHSITDGALLVTTIVFWDFFLDWLAYRFPAVARFVSPPPLLLVKAGQMLCRNMRQELVTEEELMSLLRHQGIDDLSSVEKAFLESDGRLSAVTRAGRQPPPDQKKRVG